MTKWRTKLLLLLCVAMVFPAHTPVAAQPYIYPARGQSPQQEESDKGQCYGWAVQQSGFDPANPRVAMPPPPPSYYPQPQAPQGGLFRGAFGGAALGAVGGAIGGDAGKGAAIGAGVGGLFGMMRRHRYMEEEQQTQQEQMRQQQGYMSQEQNALARGLVRLRAPKLFNLRSDPFERAQHEAGDYVKWFVEHLFVFVPAQAIVGQHLETFREFPPRQKPGSFSVGEAMEVLMKGKGGN